MTGSWQVDKPHGSVCVWLCVYVHASWVNEREAPAVFLNTVQRMQAKMHTAQKVQKDLDMAVRLFCLFSSVCLFEWQTISPTQWCDNVRHTGIWLGQSTSFPSHNQRTHVHLKLPNSNNYSHWPSWMICHTFAYLKHNHGTRTEIRVSIPQRIPT